jgi:hypothetical protein
MLEMTSRVRRCPRLGLLNFYERAT